MVATLTSIIILLLKKRGDYSGPGGTTSVFFVDLFIMVA